MSRLNNKSLLCLAIASAFPLGTSAASDLVLEEIVITANKRSESLQDVATSVSTLGQEALDKRNINNLEDYARSITGLNYTSAGPNKNKIIVRGVSDGTPNDADFQIQSTVAIYLDEMPITSAFTSPDMHIVDVKRIELLRGPQGTLYGAGAMSGALKIITNEPSTDGFGGEINLLYAGIEDGDANEKIEGVLNIPLGDSAALRLVAFNKKDGGFIDNLGLGRDDWNTVKTSGGRVALRLMPTDALDITATYWFQESDVEGRNWYDPNLGDLKFYGVIPEEQEDSVDLFNLLLDYDLGFASLVSSTSYYEGMNDSFTDWSAGAFAVVEPLYLLSGVNPVASQTLDQTYEVMAQEIRLVSNDDGPLTWTAGLFFSKEETSFDLNIDLEELADLVAASGTPPALIGPGGPLYIGRNRIFGNTVVNEVEQLAAFGELSYDFTEKWSATLGLRYFEVDTSYETSSWGLQNMLTGVAAPAAIGRLMAAGITPTPAAVQAEIFATQALVGGTGSPDEDSDSGFNPRLGLEYRPSSDLLTYAVVSKGYRVGGVNSGLASALGAPESFDADELWNYELGFKSAWLGGAATVNGAIYYLDWDDIISVSNVGGFRYRSNAGRASVTGAEIDVAWLANDSITITGGISYSDSQLEENFCENLLAATPCLPTSADFRGAKGDPLIGVPKLSYNVAAEYQTPLRGRLDLRGILEYNYVGKSYDAYKSGPNVNKLGDYGVINLRLSLMTDQWEANLFGENLSDERGVVSSQYIAGNLSPVVYERDTVIRPRTLGVSFRYSFW